VRVRDEQQEVRFFHSRTTFHFSQVVHYYSLSRPDTTIKNETKRKNGRNSPNDYLLKEPYQGLRFVVTYYLVVLIPYFLLFFIIGDPPPGVHGEYGIYRTLRLGLMTLFSISYCALIYHLVCYSPIFRVWLTSKLLR